LRAKGDAADERRMSMTRLLDHDLVEASISSPD
jgi:hypothetical protein